MSKHYSERILDFLRQPAYRPVKARKLAKAMGIGDGEWGDFHDAVDSLRRVGRVVIGTDNAVTLPRTPPTVVGVFRGNPRGFGFVVPDSATEHGDLFIAPGDTLDAVTGDRVKCTVQSRGKREGKAAFGGRVVEIVERGNNKFVGKLELEGGIWFVQPDGNALHVPILIGDPTAKGAKSGDQVVIEIVKYPSEGRPARGVIVERLGKAGQPGVDVLSIIRQFHLPHEFPEEVLEEVRAKAKVFDAEAELRHREDLTGVMTITIDPDDAKDYDDAITLTKLDGAGHGKRGSGGAAWELGVHIADVSHFVTVGGATDTEARLRGTSVYLPRHVIPMLPEILSNGLCSLQEAEARLCKSAFIKYDAGGNVVGARFANTVIRSSKRLTYRQAQAVIDGNRGSVEQEVADLVMRMDQLARVIQKRRIADGMISLELPEVSLVLDEGGRVIDAQPEDTSFTHTIIEMFMVEANEAVARLLHGQGVPFIRRIHPEPDESAMESMARFMRAAGFNVPKKVTPGDVQALLAPLKGKPESYAVNLAVLKSMETAEYSPKQIGHFALASKCYGHFTSPIRRYADLTVHRLLDMYLKHGAPDGGARGKRGVRVDFSDAPSYEELEELGKSLSYLSRRAESAEDELKTLKVLELLAREHLGDEFDGVVTGVTNFGMFVQHPKYLIDGLLRLEDLGDDWWEVDLRAGRVVGERTRQTFMMGSLVTVKIADVDIAARQMKLMLLRRKPGSGKTRLVEGGEGKRKKPQMGGRRGRSDGRRAKSFRKRGGGRR
ncbi:MAG: ribonuclease R [Planctomycetes bacterium]|nr:ribonuclease R [Planctomycetota bacterium]